MAGLFGNNQRFIAAGPPLRKGPPSPPYPNPSEIQPAPAGTPLFGGPATGGGVFVPGSTETGTFGGVVQPPVSLNTPLPPSFSTGGGGFTGFKPTPPGIGGGSNVGGTPRPGSLPDLKEAPLGPPVITPGGGMGSDAAAGPGAPPAAQANLAAMMQRKFQRPAQQIGLGRFRNPIPASYA